MQPFLQLQTYTIGSASYQLYQPNEAALKSLYQQRLQQNAATPFPYWGRVWPAALTLAAYLHQNTHLIQQKKVLEIAAGLGLPSLVVAPFASHVLCTDYDADAVAAIQQTIAHHGFTHLKAAIFNWQNPLQYPAAEVVLLSDVNYEPEQFDALYKLLHHYYDNHSTILLCSPQRLMAKAFIESIQWMVQDKFTPDNDELACQIWVLRKG